MQYHKQVTSFSSRTCHVISCQSFHVMSLLRGFGDMLHMSVQVMCMSRQVIHFISCQMSCYLKMALQSQYLKMNEPLSSNSFLSVLNRDITLFMNLWKYLFSCLWGADGCSEEAGELDSDILCDGLFLGGPAGEAEISASASRTRRTTCNKKKHMICSGYWPGVNFIIK